MRPDYNHLVRVYFDIENTTFKIDETRTYTDKEIDDYPSDTELFNGFFINHKDAENAVVHCNEEFKKGYYKICKDCGKYFYLNERERDWYENRDMTPPKRCFDCRQKRKAQNNQQK